MTLFPPIPDQPTMTISHLSLVNQKLAYANVIIRNLEDSTSAINAAQKLNQQALGDAVVFHLMTALHFYLRELAEHQSIKNLSAINSTQDLIESLEQADRISSESIELHALSQTPGSWLCQLLNYHDHLLQSPKKRKEKKSFGQENLIVLVELTEAEDQAPLALSKDALKSWLSSFHDLIIRQRETSAEF